MGKKPTSKKTVVLRVYKGVKLSYNEDGTVQNDNQLIKTEHNTNEWRALMSTLSFAGYAKVDVEKVFLLDDSRTEINDFEDIKTEVELSYKPKVKEKETPQDKKIAELEAKLEALMNSVDSKSVDKIKKEESIDDLRDEYERLYEKKVFNGWNAEQLKQKISDKK